MRLSLAILLPTALLLAASEPPRPLEVYVDATDAPRGRFHTQLRVPARPGPLTLAYPKWIQGEHGPNGPITQLTDLRIHAGGKVVPWHRDPLEAWLFQVEVPAGVDHLTVDFDYLSPSAIFGAGLGRTPNATPHLLIVDWHDLVLYPHGVTTDTLPVQARLRLPQQWQHDGALAMRPEAEGTLVLEPTTFTTLLDSPVLAGDHFRHEVIDGGERPAVLSVAADRESQLAVPPETLAACGTWSGRPKPCSGVGTTAPTTGWSP